MTKPPPRALIADDEPLLRERLRSHLAALWPELEIVAEAKNGKEAIESFERHAPDVAFLDVQMPGMSGVDAARAIARRAEVVFVTAYERYAVAAFDAGAVDYVVKPFEAERLADTVQRLQSRLASPRPSRARDDDSDGGFDAVLERLAAVLEQRRGGSPRRHLQWLRASVGVGVRLIPVDQVVYLKSDEKYTVVAWQGGEALIRKSIRELVDELDPDTFVQIHRSVIVNLRHVAQVQRSGNDTASVHLKGRSDVLPVSRSYLHVFRQM